MNKKFAYILATAVEAGKLNDTKFVSKFVETHGTENAGLEEVKTTPEIQSFLSSFYAKKMKVTDKQLVPFFSGLHVVENKEVVTKKSRPYSAPEH